jgi:ribokinase
LITVVGSYNVDFIFKVKEFPEIDETVFSQSFKVSHGGKGSNQAVSSARLGSRVNLIACIGKDVFGRRALSFWNREGVNTEKVKVKKGVTGMAFILVNEDGKNVIAVNRGANALLTPEDLEGSLNGEVLLTQMEVRQNVVEKALKEFSGIKILNPAPAKGIIKRLLDNVDYLTPNEVEFREISGTEDLIYGTEVLLKRVKKGVIVTLGEKGAFVATKSWKRLIQAPKVKAVDSTGAGDVFNASLAVHLERGFDLREAVKISNIIASYSVTKVGALGPKIEEVREFLELNIQRIKES